MKRYIYKAMIILLLTAGVIFFWINERIAGPFIEGRALVTEGLPESKEGKKSRYKLAMIDLWQGNRKKAVQRLESLAENPDGPLAPESRAMYLFLSNADSMAPEPG